MIVSIVLDYQKNTLNTHRAFYNAGLSMYYLCYFISQKNKAVIQVTFKTLIASL